MITNFNKYLNINEYKLSSDNYDKYYYLVLMFNDKTLKNLINFEFKNLKGISNSISIVNSFFNIRNLMLVMDKNEVEELNDIKHINYYNVEELTENNFKLLKRIYGKADNYNIGSLLYQGIRKTDSLSITKKEKYGYLITNNLLKKLYRKVKLGMWTKLRLFDRDYVHLLDKIKNVKDYNDLLEKSYKLISNKTNIYTKEELDLILRFIIMSFASIFEKEKEVIIENNKFIVPKNSILFIKHYNPQSYKYDEFNKLINGYIYKLENKYKIIELPYKYGKIIDNSHKPAFAFIRYLDKIFNN